MIRPLTIQSSPKMLPLWPNNQFLFINKRRLCATKIKKMKQESQNLLFCFRGRKQGDIPQWHDRCSAYKMHFYHRMNVKWYTTTHLTSKPLYTPIWLAWNFLEIQPPITSKRCFERKFLNYTYLKFLQIIMANSQIIDCNWNTYHTQTSFPFIYWRILRRGRIMNTRRVLWTFSVT